MVDLSGFTPAAGGGVNVGGSGADYSASSATGDQGVLSGLGDLFSGVGAGIAAGIRASKGPQAVGPAGLGVYYNPSTGTYTSAYGVAGQSAMSPLLLLLGIGLIAFLVFRK